MIFNEIYLSLNPMWKYAAMDKNGIWYVYKNLPVIGKEDWSSKEEYSLIPIGLLCTPKVCDWKNSLYEIDGGKLIKYIPQFKPIIGEFYEFCNFIDFPKNKCSCAFLTETCETSEYKFITLSGRWKYCRKPEHIKICE